MYNITQSECTTENYRLLHESVKGLLSAENDLIANLANIASFIYWTLPDVNWAGFYLLKGDTLILGPFVGKPACTRISIGEGVCGTCVAHGQVVKVDDTNEFEGHIACDWDTNSEIVLPLTRFGETFGVLDVDSPHANRFTDEDKAGLSAIVETINKFLEKI